MTKAWIAGIAASTWLLACLRWFDVAAAWRPAWLAALPAWPWALATLFLLIPYLRDLVAHTRSATRPPSALKGLMLVLLVAFSFRLPLLAFGSVGYLTPDGALSGLVAHKIRTGAAHLVFVPHVPYSGSLKSHVAAVLAFALDPPRAFALASVLFYCAFVAAVYLLALRLPRADARSALWAGLYLALAPAFVTRYSLSNDGNYVEVLACGASAMLLTAHWLAPATRGRGGLAAGIGFLCGLSFWCHILAIIPTSAILLAMMACGGRAGLRSLPALSIGALLGAWPACLWNAANGWASLEYAFGLQPVGTGGRVPLGARAVALFSEQLPILFGYDRGYAPALDRSLYVAACCAAALALAALIIAMREWYQTRAPALGLMVLFTLVTMAVATIWLPYVQGIPRYLLLTMMAWPLFMARLVVTRGPWLRYAYIAILALGALGSLAQYPSAAAEDSRYREFVARLEAAGVRHCYSDFTLATMITYLSEERIVCCSKLGPVTTEYFFEYRQQVEAAPAAALIPVNRAAALKIETRLARLNVQAERLDLMKPVFLRHTRKVDPEEIYPERGFPWR